MDTSVDRAADPEGDPAPDRTPRLRPELSETILSLITGIGWAEAASITRIDRDADSWGWGAHGDLAWKADALQLMLSEGP